MIRLIVWRYFKIEESVFFEQLKKVKLLLLLVFLMACSSIQKKDDIEQEFRGIAPEFQPYVERFINITDPYYDIRPLENLNIGKKRINDGSIVGLCKIFTSNGGTEIVIDKEYWDYSPEQSREALMMHELAHCLCYLDHEHMDGSYEGGPDKPSGYFDDGCPVSLMYPTIVPTFCYDKHLDEYNKELVARCKKSRDEPFNLLRQPK